MPWMLVAGAATLVLLGVIFWLLRREPAEDVASPDVASTTTTTQSAVASVPDDCPVTIPTEAFLPPDGYPPTGRDEKFWYGTDELWTVVPIDGTSEYQKSGWWSSNFLGAGEESQPEIEVTYRLLSEETETITNSDATTGRNPEEGSFMNVGFQPDLAACWEVTASYKGATLTYITRPRAAH